jgi:hypothetical protein
MPLILCDLHKGGVTVFDYEQLIYLYASQSADSRPHPREAKDAYLTEEQVIEQVSKMREAVCGDTETPR